VNRIRDKRQIAARESPGGVGDELAKGVRSAVLGGDSDASAVKKGEAVGAAVAKTSALANGLCSTVARTDCAAVRMGLALIESVGDGDRDPVGQGGPEQITKPPNGNENDAVEETVLPGPMLTTFNGGPIEKTQFSTRNFRFRVPVWNSTSFPEKTHEPTIIPFSTSYRTDSAPPDEPTLIVFE
jgi:hypothetical protein